MPSKVWLFNIYWCKNEIGRKRIGYNPYLEINYHTGKYLANDLLEYFLIII